MLDFDSKQNPIQTGEGGLSSPCQIVFIFGLLQSYWILAVLWKFDFLFYVKQCNFFILSQCFTNWALYSTELFWTWRLLSLHRIKGSVLKFVCRTFTSDKIFFSVAHKSYKIMSIDVSPVFITKQILSNVYKRCSL